MKVPFLDLQTLHKNLRTEILSLWEEILYSAEFIGGKHIIAFEEEFARICTTSHCISTNSGTDALRFIFIALNLQPGDEVITVANTFIATTEAISQAGGKPVFVDIDPNTYNMDPDKITEVITTKTKGIVPVHLYGQSADMDRILEIAKNNGLWVVEDACQAHLAEYKSRRVGSMGTAAAFSFYPGKNLGACGDAGAVTTNNSNLAETIRKLKNHGQSTRYYHDFEGYNGRCDSLQAAALRVKLKHLQKWTDDRRKCANIYIDRLKDCHGVILPYVSDDCQHVFHLFVIQIENRDKVSEILHESGIICRQHYPFPLHHQKAYSFLKINKGTLPVTENCCYKLLSLPMYPGLTGSQISYVCKMIRSAINKIY